jgi:hypothetical protein
VNGTLKKSLWAFGFLLVCGLAVVIRLNYVHSESGEWRMRPSAEPRILRFDGHLYHREGVGFVKQAGFVKHGTDLGGGYIMAPPDGGVPPLIQVHNLRSFYDYQLAH